MLPGFSYLKNTGVSLGKGISRYADDVSDAYKMLVNGEEPVLGITPSATRRSPEAYPREVEEFQNREAINRLNEQMRNRNQGFGTMTFRDFDSSDHSDRFLPEPPEEIIISDLTSIPGIMGLNVAPRPEQYANLSQDIISQLNQIGLGRYDIQNLLDRGFSPEQMLRLSNTVTPGNTSNRRANILAQRLSGMGESPSLPTRQAYLHGYVDNGGTLLQHRGRPYTIEEWNEMSETSNMSPFDNE